MAPPRRAPLRGEITGEPSVVIEKALHRALDRQPKHPEPETAPTYDQRLAHALHEERRRYAPARV